MVKLIDDAAEVLEALIKGAKEKEKRLGAWNAPNDDYGITPSPFDDEDELSFPTSFVVIGDTEEERESGYRAQLLAGLNDEQSRLLEHYFHVSDTHEMHDTQTIEAAKQKFEASLDENGEALWESYWNAKNNETLDNIADGLHEISERLSEGKPPEQEFADAEMLEQSQRSYVEAVLPENQDFNVCALLNDLFNHQQHNRHFLGIGVRYAEEKAYWRITPDVRATEPLDWHNLRKLLREDVAKALADVSPWRCENTRQGKAYAVCDEPWGNLPFFIADHLEDNPDLKAMSRPRYLVDGCAVDEQAYFKAASNGQKVEREIFFCGPGIETKLQEYFGLRTRDIKQNQR